MSFKRAARAEGEAERDEVQTARAAKVAAMGAGGDVARPASARKTRDARAHPGIRWRLDTFVIMQTNVNGIRHAPARLQNMVTSPYGFTVYSTDTVALCDKCLKMMPFIQARMCGNPFCFWYNIWNALRLPTALPRKSHARSRTSQRAMSLKPET